MKHVLLFALMVVATIASAQVVRIAHTDSTGSYVLEYDIVRPSPRTEPVRVRVLRVTDSDADLTTAFDTVGVVVQSNKTKITPRAIVDKARKNKQRGGR